MIRICLMNVDLPDSPVPKHTDTYILEHLTLQQIEPYIVKLNALMDSLTYINI